MTKFILLILLLLSGCSLAPVKTVYVPVPIAASVDQRLLKPCSDIPGLSGPSEEMLVVWATSTITAYKECAARHRSLSASVASQSQGGKQ